MPTASRSSCYTGSVTRTNPKLRPRSAKGASHSAASGLIFIIRCDRARSWTAVITSYFPATSNHSKSSSGRGFACLGRKALRLPKPFRQCRFSPRFSCADALQCLRAHRPAKEETAVLPATGDWSRSSRHCWREFRSLIRGAFHLASIRVPLSLARCSNSDVGWRLKSESRAAVRYCKKCAASLTSRVGQARWCHHQ